VAKERCRRVDLIQMCLVRQAPCIAGKITASSAAFEAIKQLRVCDSPQEEVWVLALDQRHALRGYALVTRGSIHQSIVHPVDIFRPLITHNTLNFILVHNHPSGDPSPSAEDRALTERVAQAAKIMGLSLLDHLVITEDAYFSFRDAGLL